MPVSFLPVGDGSDVSETSEPASSEPVTDSSTSEAVLVRVNEESKSQSGGVFPSAAGGSLDAEYDMNSSVPDGESQSLLTGPNSVDSERKTIA